MTVIAGIRHIRINLNSADPCETAAEKVRKYPKKIIMPEKKSIDKT